jgi:glycosyltransferase involved in cell wall biosynthesis
MRVCLVSREEPSFSGTLRYVDRLAVGLEQRGVRVISLSTRPRGAVGRLLKKARFLGVDPYTFVSTYPIRLDWPPADLYHFTAHTYAALLRVRRPPGPVVVTVHDIGPYLDRKTGSSGYGHRVHRAMDEVAVGALKRADAIIAVSDWTRRTLSEATRTPTDRITVAYLGVDHARYRPNVVSPRFRERYGLTDDVPYLLYVGNDEPRKNVRLLLKALKIVRSTADRAVLLKVGASQRGRQGSHQLAEDLGVTSAVRFFVGVPEEDLPSFYNVADVVVMPSIYEGFGLPALEAMASGTPLIATRAGALPEVTGQSGARVVDPQDVAELAKAVIELLSDRQLATRLGRQGFLRAKEFTWDRTVDRTIDLYRTLLPTLDAAPAD